MAPILPGLSDRPELLADVVKAARDAGATSIWTNVLVPPAGHARALPREPGPRLAGARAALRAPVRRPGVPRRSAQVEPVRARGRASFAIGSHRATGVGPARCRPPARRAPVSNSSSTSVAAAAGRRRGTGGRERAHRGRPQPASASRLGYPEADGPPALPQDPARRAPLPPRRRGDAGDHVEHRPRPGHQAADPRLLGVPGHDHRLGQAEPHASTAISSSSTGRSSSRARRSLSSGRSTRSSAAPTARTT